MITRPSQQYFARCIYGVKRQKSHPALTFWFMLDDFLFALQALFLLCNLCLPSRPVVLPGHLSQHAKVATADGQTSSYSIDKKKLPVILNFVLLS
jgi:hypothetical protein